MYYHKNYTSRTRLKPNPKLIIGLTLLAIIVFAFIGFEPLASYKNIAIAGITTTAHEVRLEIFPTDSEIQTDTLALINQARIEHNLPALATDSFLENIAIQHCYYMISKHSCNHDNFNSRADTILSMGHFIVAENVAEGYLDANSLVNGWLSSPGHRQNILNSSFNYTGLAYIDGFSCQIFSD